MRISTRGRFAIAAMIDLALRESAYPTPLQDLALRHKISLSYLEQVFAKLRQRGLVESTRGPGGGYTLGMRASDITVADIISAIEISPATNLQGNTAENAEEGADMLDLSQDLWDNLHSTIMTYLQTITLSSLAAEQRAKGFQVTEKRSGKKSHSGISQPQYTPVRTSAPNSVFALAQTLA
jgi:Rrf2 family iron-sulfur cluster assembly transcriptional regulator